MDGNRVGVNMIWALAFVLIVAMIAGTVYYSGFLSNVGDKEIDVKIDAPSAPANQ